MSGPRFFIYAIFAASFGATSVLAGPPLITDDPDTPGPSNWEIDVAAITQHIAHEWQLQSPFLDMNYGVGDSIELTYEIGWNVFVPEGHEPVGGLDNSLLGVKWRFLDQTNAGLDISVYPQFAFNNPTTSVQRGLAADGTSFLLPMEIGRHFGPLDIYCEPGCVVNEFGASGGFCGIAVEYDLTEKFTIMGELHSDFDHTFENSDLIFNIGFQQTLTEHVALIGSAGRAIYGPTESAPDFLSYLALQFTF